MDKRDRGVVDLPTQWKDDVIVTKLNKMDSKGGHMHQFGDLCDFTGNDFGDGPATFTQRGYSHQKFSSIPIEEDYLERTDLNQLQNALGDKLPEDIAQALTLTELPHLYPHDKKSIQVVEKSAYNQYQYPAYKDPYRDEDTNSEEEWHPKSTPLEKVDLTQYPLYAFRHPDQDDIQETIYILSPVLRTLYRVNREWQSAADLAKRFPQFNDPDTDYVVVEHCLHVLEKRDNVWSLHRMETRKEVREKGSDFYNWYKALLPISFDARLYSGEMKRMANITEKNFRDYDHGNVIYVNDGDRYLKRRTNGVYREASLHIEHIKGELYLQGWAQRKTFNGPLVSDQYGVRTFGLQVRDETKQELGFRNLWANHNVHEKRDIITGRHHETYYKDLERKYTEAIEKDGPCDAHTRGEAEYKVGDRVTMKWFYKTTKYYKGTNLGDERYDAIVLKVNRTILTPDTKPTIFKYDYDCVYVDSIPDNKPNRWKVEGAALELKDDQEIKTRPKPRFQVGEEVLYKNDKKFKVTRNDEIIYTTGPVRNGNRSYRHYYAYELKSEDYELKKDVAEYEIRPVKASDVEIRMRTLMHED